MGMLGRRRAARAPGLRVSRASSGPEAEAADSSPDELTILRLAHDGRGIARDASGKTVFVAQALPGERVRVAIHRSRKRFDEAHLRELLVPSAERISPPCPHYAQCGGCDLQHLALQAQREHKREVLIDQLARQGVSLEVSPRLLGGEAFDYRRRARLGVKVDAKGEVHLGFRARGSRHLVDIRDCPILVPELAGLLTPLRECLDALQAPRQVGHIELLAGDEAVAVVVRQLRADPVDARRWRQWADTHRLSLAFLRGREQPELQWVGKVPRLSYTLKSGQRHLELEFAPGDFLQVNAEANQSLVATALDWLAPASGDRVLDLFAGTGNFTLALAPHVARVISVEGSTTMVKRLQDNARRNGLKNIESHTGDLNQPPSLEPLPDIVVLDPPRGGAEATCRALATSRVARILYVSCDPATLARDAAHLVQAGYRITRAAVVDMFVQTAHLEAALLFERESFQHAP
ncbi:23S rRNA m(5)U-1939 methyltransferase [Modicisalibacter ilicicola DSM 19980]|uniref:23S rRNA (uracil(1939)-C(5))-methyltransferase RlmD n=1 Tax=Modicisalibacter ilicicola DSM 19980 TaxID=1121942 RepID=A0A1M5D8U2_9GAMM|nr:23S rRNA (uracil(1939)-C(5))-methyltransferase RlmD [Halomonas ilicicola]SHF63295.1 23S rRNA m(5)U-1939 methyltransferase [Halomonas ilicicola DSM 19980]